MAMRHPQLPDTQQPLGEYLLDWMTEALNTHLSQEPITGI